LRVTSRGLGDVYKRQAVSTGVIKPEQQSQALSRLRGNHTLTWLLP
jgi:hypothetical protein